jgi:hypothetical protein
MKRIRRSVIALQVGSILALPVVAGPAFAQESASFRIKTPVLNNGGRPLDGLFPSSANYRLRPDALGEGAVQASAVSASFRLAGGFLQAFPPPGEVKDLRFTNATTLAWDPEPFADSYHLYRTGPMGSGIGTMPVGNCLQSGIAGLTTTEPDVPPTGKAFFYLVNAVNCTRIEGPADPTGTRCP